MRCDTVFGDVVHFPCSYLHLKGYARAAYDRCMQRLVHVGLRSGDIVLETSGHTLVHLVDYTECRIAFKLRLHNYTKRVEVVYLVKLLRLVVHFTVYTVYRFDSALKCERYIVLFKNIRNVFADVFNKVAVLPVFFLYMSRDLGVSYRVKVQKRKIFKLLLYALHTETVRKRRIHVHGLKRSRAALALRLCVKSAHVVQPVAELYKYDSYILGHGEKHTADVLHLRFFFILNVYIHHLCEAGYKHCHVGSELFFYSFYISLIGAVFNRIVKKCRAYGVRIKSQRRNYLGDGNRVDYIRLSAVAELPFVQIRRVKIRFAYFIYIIFFPARLKHRHKVADRSHTRVVFAVLKHLYLSLFLEK